MTDIIHGENNNSAHAECVQGFHSESKNAQYLLVDYGEKLVTEMEFSRNELHKQTISLLEKVELLWDVLRSFIILMIPVTTGLGLAVLSRMYLPNIMAPWGFTVFFGITVGFVFLNLTPLTEAVSIFLDYKVYSPQFALNCKCDSCQSKGEANKGTHTADGVNDSADNIGKSAVNNSEVSTEIPDLNELD